MRASLISLLLSTVALTGAAPVENGNAQLQPRYCKRDTKDGQPVVFKTPERGLFIGFKHDVGEFKKPAGSLFWQVSYNYTEPAELPACGHGTLSGHAIKDPTPYINNQGFNITKYDFDTNAIVDEGSRIDIHATFSGNVVGTKWSVLFPFFWVEDFSTKFESRLGSHRQDGEFILHANGGARIVVPGEAIDISWR